MSQVPPLTLEQAERNHAVARADLDADWEALRESSKAYWQAVKDLSEARKTKP